MVIRTSSYHFPVLPLTSSHSFPYAFAAADLGWVAFRAFWGARALTYGIF